MSLIRIVVAVTAFSVVGCGIPADPEGTLDRVRGGTLRVGVTSQPPWTEAGNGAEPSGIEVGIVEGLAAELDADIAWHEGSADGLAAAVHQRELDLLIGGLTSTSTLAGEITLTHPYLTTQTVIAVGSNEQIPTDIAGIEVAVEEGTAAAGILAKTDAVVVRVEDVTTFSGAIAVEDIFLEDLGVIDTQVRLEETDHVMGVPGGENDWLTTVERFLLDNTALIQDLVEGARP